MPIKKSSDSLDTSLARLLTQIRLYPMLTAEEEASLVKIAKNLEDPEAAKKAKAKLVQSHLRLVAKTAAGFRNYGFPLEDLISAGSVGLAVGVDRFELNHGARMGTYTEFWIRAAIYQHIMHEWSLVRINVSAIPKKLFFRLPRLKAQIGAYGDEGLHPEHSSHIAHVLGVPEKYVIEMDRRLGRDSSLNVPVREGSDLEKQDVLADARDNQEVRTINRNELNYRRQLFKQAWPALTQREQEIVRARRLSEDPLTLSELAHKHNVSKERIRQIEQKALEKLAQVAQAGVTTPREQPTSNNRGADASHNAETQQARTSKKAHYPLREIRRNKKAPAPTLDA